MLALLALMCLGLPGHTQSPRVVSVENAGLLFTDNRAGVTGTDAGYSYPIGKHTLWMFGDIFLHHPTDPGRRSMGFISNAGLLVSGGGGTASLAKHEFLLNAATGVARQVMPLEQSDSNDIRLWPFGGWWDEGKKEMNLFYGRVQVTSGGPFGFKLLGTGLARASTREPSRMEFRRIDGPEGNPVWWPASEAVFGSAVISGTSASDPYLYVVGYREEGGKKVGCMARVRREKITDLGAYEYLSQHGESPRWSASIQAAGPIEGLTDFPSELSIAYNRYLRGYLVVHQVGIGEGIRLSLSQHPWGPYRQIAEIAAPHRAFEKAFCYAGKEHPELAEQGGKVIYITYVDSQRYWLQLLKVTLNR